MGWGRRQGSGEWYTPPEIVEAARATMGRIDCDPATCAVAQRVVQADVWYDRAKDGLAQPWRGAVLLNPPWGVPPGNVRLRGAAPKVRFVAKLARHIAAGDVSQAVVVLAADAGSTRWFREHLAPHLAAIAWLVGRVPYWQTAPDAGVRASRGTAICYFGARTTEFARHFGGMGICLRPIPSAVAS